MTEHSHDFALPGHMEIYTNGYDESLGFTTNLNGPRLSGEDGTIAYPTAWDDSAPHRFKLTRHHTNDVSQVANRASAPEKLERRVAVIRASGFKFCG